MRTFETTAVLGQDRRLIIDLPTDVEPGARRVVVILDDEPQVTSPADFRAGWPRHDTAGPGCDEPKA